MAVRSEARARPAVGSVERASLHPGAWLAWLVAASTTVLLTSNPLYLSVAFLAALGVYLSVRDTTKGRAFGPFVLLGAGLAIATVPFNVLTGSVGPTELGALPELSLPRWFGGVTLGGSITAEALVAASSRAIGIATLVMLAASFNAAVDHFRLLRSAPRALSQLMLSVTVAAVVVPQAMARGRAVAEARRLRGRPARGLRVLPAVLLPVLHGALERSVQRAESMDARGLAGGRPPDSGPVELIGVVGLGLVAWGAFWHFYDGAGPLAAATIAAGMLATGWTLVRGGLDTPERLRRDRWGVPDVAVAVASALALVVIVSMRATGAGDIEYVPYPEVVAPGFHLVAAAALLLLVAPALTSAASEVEA